LFDHIGQAVCAAGCLPRKELFEAWEVARRVRRLFRGGRVVDLGGGHGLLGQMLLLLDDSSPAVLVVDPAVPKSAGAVHDALRARWPRIAGRVTFVSGDLASVVVQADDIVVSAHACGSLTDRVLAIAARAGARVAVLPCCHDLDIHEMGSLEGWVDKPLAVDIMRAVTLQRRGYRTWTQSIPAAITPKNRLLLGRMAAISTPAG
jgi:hypothetical protein